MVRIKLTRATVVGGEMHPEGWEGYVPQSSARFLITIKKATLVADPVTETESAVGVDNRDDIKLHTRKGRKFKK